MARQEHSFSLLLMSCKEEGEGRGGDARRRQVDVGRGYEKEEEGWTPAEFTTLPGKKEGASEETWW